MSINERFGLIIKTLFNGNQKAFSDTVGVAPTVVQNVVGSRKGKPSFDVIQKILIAIANLNADWLITGRGKMLLSDKPDYEVDNNDMLVLCDNAGRKYDKQLIPIYDLQASAGLVSLFRNPSDFSPVDYLMIPNIGKVDGGIFAFGDSMYPLIKSGDIPIYRQLNNIEYSTIWGETYILSFDLEGEEYIVIKYVQRSEIAGHVKLVSQNQHHQPIDISMDRINAYAQVKASVRYMTIRTGI